MNRNFAETVINKDLDFERTYVWDETLLREIIANKIKSYSEEKINEIIEKIGRNEEVIIESGSYISKFHLATPEEAEAAMEYEEERIKELDEKGGDITDFKNLLNEMLESQFE